MASSKMHFTGRLQDMDLRLLRVYKAVVESGGFSAAEVELNVSRSTISASMSDLETRLGLKLCKRGRSGFSLTSAGSQVYEITLQLLNSMDLFRDQLNTIHSHLKGELNIGITDNLITMWRSKIVKSLQRLKKESPDVVINITIMPPNEIEKAVLNGQLDIGMAPKTRDCPGLEYLALYEEQSYLFCGEEHSLFTMADADITTQQVLENDTVALSYALPDAIQQIYDQHKIKATVSDREGVVFLLMTGCFIGYLPSHYAQKWVDTKTLRKMPLANLGYTTQIMAVTKNEINTDLILRNYLNALKDAY